MENLNKFESLRVAPAHVTLRQQVVEVLRAAITDGRFQPGERLKERVLCEMTGVSRTSVREALRHLESERLVYVLPNKGPIVATLTLDEASKIYEVRSALEGMAGKIFAERASTEDISQLQSAFNGLKSAFEAGGPMKEISDKTSVFYQVFLDRCGNDVAASMVRSLDARIVYLRSQSIKRTGRLSDSIAEIERMVGAIVRRDPDGARLLCEDHVRQARSAALAELETLLNTRDTDHT